MEEKITASNGHQFMGDQRPLSLPTCEPDLYSFTISYASYASMN
jgi:hypothetical protein